MMLIRHQRAEDDIALKPEWTEYYPKYKSPFADGPLEDCDGDISNPEAGTSCPFAFLTW